MFLCLAFFFAFMVSFSYLVLFALQLYECDCECLFEGVVTQNNFYYILIFIFTCSLNKLKYSKSRLDNNLDACSIDSFLCLDVTSPSDSVFTTPVPQTQGIFKYTLLHYYV